MTTKQKVLVGVVLALIALTSAFIGGRVAGGSSLLGLASINGYEAGIKWFGNGLYAGLSQQYSVDSNGQVTSATTTNTTSYSTIGGVHYASVEVPMVATSSVPCSITNPFGGDSALLLNYFASTTANGIGGTQLIDVSTSSTAYASSSPAFVKKFSAGSGNFAIPWQPGNSSTTPNVIGNDSFSKTGTSPFKLGPNEFLNTNVATGTPGTFSSYYTGYCAATFMKT